MTTTTTTHKDPTTMNHSTNTHQLDHDAAARRARKMTDEALAWSVKDAREALEAATEMDRAGFAAPKIGYYADEVHVFAGEIHRRRIAAAKKAA